jgi:flagellar motor protein MotB
MAAVHLFAQTPTTDTAVTTPPSVTSPSEEDLEAKLQQLAKRSEELAKESEERLKQHQSARAEAQRLRAENARLRERLERVEQAGPSRVELQERFWNDRRASVTFTTDALARVAARLKEVGGREYPELRSELGTVHTFHWDGLAPEREYRLSVAAFDLSEQQRAAASGSSLDFKTTPPDSGPIFTFAAEPNARTSSSVSFSYTLSEPAYVTLECRQRVSKKSVETIPCRTPQVGKVELNDVRKPVGELKSAGVHTVTVDGLDPDSEYVFKPLAYDDRGLELQNPISSPIYGTASRLDFDGPVNLELAPTKVRISWKTTTEPREARARLLFPDGEDFGGKPATYVASERRVVTEIPLADLVRAVAADPKSAKPPTIEATMTGDTGPLVRHFTVSVVVPTATANLSQDQRNAVQALGEAITSPNRKKVAWKDLLELGLPVLLSFL